MGIIANRAPPCRWPWPYVELANGFQMENSEVLIVRCLKDFDGSIGSKAKAGTRVGLRHDCRGRLELVNFGRGNRRYVMIKPAPVEGEDFETIPGEKLWLANRQARDIIDEAIGTAAAAARSEREIGPKSYDYK